MASLTQWLGYQLGLMFHGLRVGAQGRKLSVYAGAKRTRQTDGWGSYDVAPNVALQSDGPLLRGRARELDRDNPVVRGSLDSYVDSVLSNPIQVRSAVRFPGSPGQPLRDRQLARQWNMRCDELWTEWANDPMLCDLSGHQTFDEMQDLFVHSIRLSGEVLILRHRRENPRGIPDVRLEFVEPDCLGGGWSVGKNMASREWVRDGIEYDEDLRPRKFWIQRNRALGLSQAEEWDARDVIHAYVRRRPGQVIGETALAPGAETIFHLGSWLDSETKQNSALAKIFGVVKAFSPESVFPTADQGSSTFPSDSGAGEVSEARRVASIQLGQILELEPGEEFSQIAQNRPGTSFGILTKALLKMFSNSQGQTYEQASGDYSESNYSSARMAMMAKQPGWRKWRRRTASRFVGESRRWWIEEGLLGGELEFIPGLDELREYYRHRTQLPGDAHVDPAKEMIADGMALAAGRLSLGDLVARDGGDLEEQAEKVAEAIEIYKRHGIPITWFDSTPAAIVPGQEEFIAKAGIGPEPAEDGGDGETQNGNDDERIPILNGKSRRNGWHD